MGAPRISKEKKQHVLRLLEAAVFTQKEIAEICGVGISTVSDIKNRKYEEHEQTPETETMAFNAVIIKQLDALIKTGELITKQLDRMLEVWGAK